MAVPQRVAQFQRRHRVDPGRREVQRQRLDRGQLDDQQRPVRGREDVAVGEVAPQCDVSDTNSYNGGITSGFANRLIIEVMGSMALAAQGLSAGDPIKPREPLGPSEAAETPADD